MTMILLTITYLMCLAHNIYIYRKNLVIEKKKKNFQNNAKERERERNL